MSFETMVFREQLTKLDTVETELKKSEKDLSELVCSGMFASRVSFQSAVRDFGSKIITSVQTIQQPVEGLPSLSPEELTVNPDEEHKTEKSRISFGYPQAGLLAVGIIACLILAVYSLIPPMTGVYVVLTCIALSFGPSIASFLGCLLHKENENESKSLDDWIAESLQWMLDQYDGTRYLAKTQNQKAEDMPNYVLLGIPAELYDREKQNADTLPGDFLARIIKIMVECNKAFTIRRAMIFNAISAVKQTSVTKT